jgi:hypothetical protein
VLGHLLRGDLVRRQDVRDPVAQPRLVRDAQPTDRDHGEHVPVEPELPDRHLDPVVRRPRHHPDDPHLPWLDDIDVTDDEDADD